MSLMTFSLGEGRDPKLTHQQRERHWEESLGVLRAAVAARPRSPFLRQWLGLLIIERFRSIDPAGPGYYLDEALRICREEVLAHPGDGVARRRLGTALWLRGDRKAALAALRRAIEFDPQNVLHHQELHYCLSQIGDGPGLIAAYRKAIEVDREHAGQHLANLAEWLKAKGDLEGAVAAYRQLIEAVPAASRVGGGFTQVYWSLGRLLQGKGDLEGAIATFRKGLQLIPPKKPEWAHDRKEGYEGLAETLRQKGDFDEAMATFRKAVAADPKGFRNYLRLGAALVHDRSANVPDALAALRQAVEAYPQMAWAHHELGLALQSRNDREGAVSAYGKAMLLDPKEGCFWAARASAYQLWGQWDKAAADWSKVLEVAPDFGGTLLQRARAYRKLGQRDLALADYFWALRQDPSDSAILSDLAELYGEMGQWDRVVALSPQKAQGYYLPGQALKNKGDLEGAVAAYGKAIEMSPQGTWRNDLARLLATCPDPKVRDPKKAVELARTNVNRMPRSGEFWSTLGLAHYRAGDAQAAVDALTRSMTLRPGEVVDWLFLAMAQQKLGHRDEARKWYDQAVQWLDKHATALAQDPSQAEEFRRLRTEAEEVLGLKKN